MDTVYIALQIESKVVLGGIPLEEIRLKMGARWGDIPSLDDLCWT
jgi:hypothetical protein